MAEAYRVLCSADADRDHWLGLRMHGVGSSEVPALYDCGPYDDDGGPRKDAGMLLSDKVYGAIEINNRYVYWGNKLENEIIIGYFEHGHQDFDPDPRYPIDYSALKTRTGGKWAELLQSNINPRLLATPDGRQFCTVRGRDGVLQIKLCGAYFKPTAETKRSISLLETRRLPEYYRIQVMAELAVTGMQWGTLAALVNGRHLLYWDIERDETLIADIFDRVERFWRLVEKLKKKEAA